MVDKRLPFHVLRPLSLILSLDLIAAKRAVLWKLFKKPVTTELNIP